jgi:hypothetical protein
VASSRVIQAQAAGSRFYFEGRSAKSVASWLRIRQDMKKKAAKEVYTLVDLQNWEEIAGAVNPPVRLGVFGNPLILFSPNAERRLASRWDRHAICALDFVNELKDAEAAELDFVGIISAAQNRGA